MLFPKIKLRENLSNNPIDLIYDFLEQEGISLEQLKKEETSWNDDGKKKMSEFLKELGQYREKEEREKFFLFLVKIHLQMITQTDIIHLFILYICDF